MGNDGGSYAKRAELVKQKKKEIRVESELVAKFRAKFCALTQERLKKPVAACRLGYLYNYDTLIERILDKTIPKELQHISKIKNIKELNITENPNKNDEFPFICPISQIALNGKNKFFVLWSCGCVFSDKLLKDLGIKEKKCPICNKPYNKNEMIELCPTNEEAELRKAHLYSGINKKIKTCEENEPKIEKKICIENQKTQQQKPHVNKLQQLQINDEKEITNNEIYKSLFHKNYTLEDNLFTRNVRFGNR